VTKLTNLEIQAEQLPSRYATEETEPFVLPNPDEIIVATKGALHEHLTELAKAIVSELDQGTFRLDIARKDPAYFASNILARLVHSGDGRIRLMDLKR
jgi:hypothetical protein